MADKQQWSTQEIERFIFDKLCAHDAKGNRDSLDFRELLDGSPATPQPEDIGKAADYLQKEGYVERAAPTNTCLELTLTHLGKKNKCENVTRRGNQSSA